MPWLTGGFIDEEFQLRLVNILGVVFALPAALAANWLTGTRYSLIGMGYGVLVCAWTVLLAVTIKRELRRARTPA